MFHQIAQRTPHANVPKLPSRILEFQERSDIRHSIEQEAKIATLSDYVQRKKFVEDIATNPIAAQFNHKTTPSWFPTACRAKKYKNSIYNDRVIWQRIRNGIVVFKGLSSLLASASRYYCIKVILLGLCLAQRFPNWGLQTNFGPYSSSSWSAIRIFLNDCDLIIQYSRVWCLLH